MQIHWRWWASIFTIAVPCGSEFTYHPIFRPANINWNTAYYVSGARHINMDRINSLCAKHLKAKELLYSESRTPTTVPELWATQRQKPEQKPLYQSRWPISCCSNQMTPQVCISPTSYPSTIGQLRAILCVITTLSLEIFASTHGRRKRNSWMYYMDRTLYVTYIQNSLARTGHMATPNHGVPRSEILSCAQNGGDLECLTFAWAPFPTSSSSSFLFFFQFNLHFNLHYVWL